MARRAAKVTWKQADRERIPDALAEGVALTVDLDRRNVLEAIGERVRIRREGGYCGFDVLLFLLLYFTARRAIGIRKFWELVRSCSRPLAAVAHRKQLPSPASMSRALDAVEPELFRPAGEWLLSEGAGIDAVLRHPAVQTYDARGQGWHVFDFDPTVTTLRQRALPEGEDLPSARRRSKQATAGYAGRKRGEVQFRRGTLQHAGSSAWLQAVLGPGNGDGHAELRAALHVVVRTCRRIDHPLCRAVLRMDGEFGWVPYMDKCRTLGVPFLTRVTRPEMFEQSEVLRILREGTWHFVPDSLSGPRRSALDLGVVTIPPGVDTRRQDGTLYEPVSVRVVASRYPRTEKAEHGRVIDGWQYELFVVDVSIEALPAPAAVALYFGRSAQENRFAQEDREVELDRIYSYHLPGQEFAVVVGLWVWNLRLARGFELDTPPITCPVQGDYAAIIDTRGPGLSAAATAGADPSVQAPPVSPDVPVPPVSPVASRDERQRPVCEAPTYVMSLDERPAESLAADGTHTDDKSCVPSAPASLVSSDEAPQAEQPTADNAGVDAQHAVPSVDEQIVAQLRRIDWPHALRKYPGWSWDPTTRYLQCIDGQDLVLTTIRSNEHSPGRTYVIFCRPGGGCDPCPARTACFRSDNPQAVKHIELSVPTPIAARLRDLLRARRTLPVPAPAPAGRAHKKRTGRSFPISQLSAGPARLTVLPSLFLPAAARHALRVAIAALTVAVAVSSSLSAVPSPRLVAESIAALQHRRKTWRQHFDRYALPSTARVHIEFSGGDPLRRIFGPAEEEAA